MADPDVSRSHPRDAIAERNLEAILEGAERLMVRGDAPMISAVASEAGVSRPTVYAHFPDRRRVVEAVVERTVERSMQAIRAAEPDRGRAPAALRRLTAAAWEQLSRHEQISTAAAHELSPEAMHRAHRAAIGALHRLLERGRSEAAFRTDLPADLLVTASLALIHAVADAARAGVLDGDAAGAAAETLVTELWRPAVPVADGGG